MTESHVPALNERAHVLRQQLGVGDVGSLDVEQLPPRDCVEIVAALEAQLAAALAPARAVVTAARGRILAAIDAAGAKALPHDTFDVRIEQTTRAAKRIDVLQRLKDVLPDDLYRQAVYVRTLDVDGTDPQLVAAAIAGGARPTWDADLRKLNKFARDFGGDVAEIVAAGTPRTEVGERKLVVEPRRSALKAVTP